MLPQIRAHPAELIIHALPAEMLMFARTRSMAPTIAAIFAIGVAFTLPALGQDTLYNNGPDGNSGYFHVNFGAITTNSFSLPNSATLSYANLTIYAVDDGNPPVRLKWTITTEPFGGTVEGEGFVFVNLLQDPYPTRSQFFAWKIGFAMPDVTLPAGTYYLQIEDVVTLWYTYAFWAQSSGGSSQAFYEPIGANGAGGVSQVPSESFSILGQWSSAQPEETGPRN